MEPTNEEIVIVESNNSLTSTIKTKAVEAIVGAVIMTAFGIAGSLIKQKLEERKLASQKTPVVETTATEDK